jgi:hypothetical protein
LSPAVVEAYFAERRAVGYVGHVIGRALQPLVGYLRRLGVVLDPVPVAPASPVERLLAQYWHWQLAERGLIETTADLNVRLVRPFLLDRSKTTDGESDLKHLKTGEVSGFVVAYDQARPRSVKRMVSALRSLLGLGVIG